MSDTNDKYVTFKREDFYTFLRTVPAHQQMIFDGVGELELPDAVIIRRQDLFASPCLATYASMISMVAKGVGDPELLAIADYFEDQARLAAEEGRKYPDR
jgi:hypothetical protein